MDDDEVHTVLEFGPAMLGVTKARDIMRLKYQDRDYDGKLLTRLLKKGYAQHFGSEPDAMFKFMYLGNSIRQSGGIFEFKIGIDCRITDVFVMKSSMTAYAELFGDFVINDGTHNVDIYGLILTMNTLVDSLGKLIMSSYSQLVQVRTLRSSDPGFSAFRTRRSWVYIDDRRWTSF